MRFNLLLLLGILWLGTPDLSYGNKNPESKLLNEQGAAVDRAHVSPGRGI